VRSIAVFFAVLLCETAAAEASSRVPAANTMPARKVTIIVDETSSTEIEIDYPARPCVDRNLVNLILGERILVEADVRDGRLVNLKRVEKTEHPDQTLEIGFSQNQERKSPLMILQISNPFSKLLTYEAGIQPLGRQGFARTSTLPVRPRLTNYESWPNPVTRILLRNFRLLDTQPREPPNPGSAGAKQ